jgi:hypothetical protein
MVCTMAPDPRVSAIVVRERRTVTRRGVLLAVGLSGIGALVGCDAGADRASSTRRSGQQDTPVAAPAPPLADTALLLRIWQDTQDLQRDANAVSAPRDRRGALVETRRILGIQEAVLGRLVRAQGGGTSPESGDAATTTPLADSASDTTGPAPDLAEVAAALSPLDRLPGSLEGVSPSNLPTLMSLYGVRFAAAQMLGRSLDWTPPAGPSGASAVTLLAGLRQAVYGFEVIAARAGGGERERYRAALTTLRPMMRTVTELAGEAAPAAPLGYGWDARVDSEAARLRAARELSRPLPAAVIAGSSARAGDGDAITGTVQAMATVVGVGREMGVPLSGFPGLSVPELPDS